MKTKLLTLGFITVALCGVTVAAEEPRGAGSRISDFSDFYENNESLWGSLEKNNAWTVNRTFHNKDIYDGNRESNINGTGVISSAGSVKFDCSEKNDLFVCNANLKCKQNHGCKALLKGFLHAVRHASGYKNKGAAIVVRNVSPEETEKYKNAGFAVNNGILNRLLHGKKTFEASSNTTEEQLQEVITNNLTHKSSQDPVRDFATYIIGTASTIQNAYPSTHSGYVGHYGNNADQSLHSNATAHFACSETFEDRDTCTCAITNSMGKYNPSGDEIPLLASCRRSLEDFLKATYGYKTVNIKDMSLDEWQKTYNQMYADWEKKQTEEAWKEALARKEKDNEN